MPNDSFKKWLMPLATFVLLLIGTALVFFELRQVSKAQLESSFLLDVEEMQIKTEDRMQQYMDILYAGRALFDASETVTREGWSEFINSLGFQERFEGIQALEYISRVTREEKESYEASIQVDYPDFSIFPAGDRDEYYVVDYIEPLEGNEAAWGFDLLSNPARQEALEKARDTGEPVVTAPITLVQETSEQAGFLIVLPIYNAEEEPTTIEARRNAIDGFVLAVFQAGDLLHSVVGELENISNIGVDVYDISDEESILLTHQGATENYHPDLLIQNKLTLYPRTWMLEFRALNSYSAQNHSPWGAWVFLLGGILVSGLVAIVIYLFSSSKEKAIDLANELTKDLKKYKLAVDNAYNHIIITDPEGVIVYANKAVERITGYKAEEVLGKTPALWGKQMDTAFYEQLWATIKTQKQVYTGEITNKRKNGILYTANLYISPILDETGTILFFVGIEEDITKKKEIDRMKTEFLSFAAHQLRTPLTNMRWFSEMLLEGDAGSLNAEQTDFTRNIQESNKRLLELVNTLLNVTKIESGKLMVKPSPVDLNALLKELLADYSQRMEEKSVKVLFTESGPKKVVADAQLIREVFSNLISNAIKYSESEGKVEVQISEEQQYYIVCVKDHGLGIPQEEQGHIFKKLYRAKNVKDIDVNGAGLGLYLVQAIVESSQGEVWFESQEGQGTTFFVRLPKGELTSSSSAEQTQP